MSEERELNENVGKSPETAESAPAERLEEAKAETESAKPNEAALAAHTAAKENDVKKDDSIDTMTVDEMASKEEKPHKTSSQKAAEKKKAKKPDGKFKKFWKKHKGIFIFLILVIIGLIVFLVYKKSKAAQEAAASASSTEFALVEKQDIRDTISTTGTIISPKTSQLISSFKEATKITNVYFEVGDHVNEGDVVVTYSTETIEKNISNAEEDLATAKEKEALQAENIERTYLDSYSDQAYNLQSSSESVDQALKDLYEACDAYGDAKRARDNYTDDDNNELDDNTGYSKDYLNSQVSSTYQAEQKAQKTYNDAVVALNKANSTTASSLAKADYQKAYDSLGLEENTTSKERQLETYQDSLEDYIVTAPISGLVTKVEVEEGNGFTSGNVMTIQEDDVLYITTEIDEYDIPSVEVGQEVVIKTDATGDDELSGEVIEIAPTATSSSSGSTASTGQTSTSGATYTVKIKINTDDDRLKLGMSAKINIITAEHDGTTVVRYDAIEEDAEGNHYVRVVDNSTPSAPTSAPSDTASAGSNTGDSANSIAVIGVDGAPTGTPEAAQGAPSGSAPQADSSKKSGILSLFSGSSDTSSTPQIHSRNVYVEVGIEGDYYTEILSDDITEGMQVIVQSEFDTSSASDEMTLMMGGGGGGGPQGGGPGGGGGGPR